MSHQTKPKKGFIPSFQPAGSIYAPVDKSIFSAALCCFVLLFLKPALPVKACGREF